MAKGKLSGKASAQAEGDSGSTRALKAPKLMKQAMHRALELPVIKEQGITTIIVEQNAVRALELSDRAVILDTGKIVFDGTASEVLENESLRAEYLAI